MNEEFDASKLWIFDEIHKYRKWKNHLKGIYDQHHEKHQLLITGSARLELFRKAGDSLQGRYHLLRLHPFSAAELKLDKPSDLMELFHLGGFPEPFLGGKKKSPTRWTKEYQSRLIEEELTTVERIQDIGAVEMLALRLPDCVGSPLSINSLREDLGYNFATVKRWLDLLEKFYGLFRIPPFGSTLVKAVKKEQKHYHYDWNCIESDGARFECMIGVHLLKHAQFTEDTSGRRMSLRFFRDIEGREVDFILTEKDKPILAVECKFSDDEVSKPLIYLKRKFPSLPAGRYISKAKKII